MTSKAKVGPSGKGFSAPRAEFCGLLVLCRVSTAALNGAVDFPAEIIVAGDSECTIATIESEICSLKDWSANRVADIEEHIHYWKSMGILVPLIHHWPGERNTANLLTRGKAKEQDVTLSSEWRTGPRKLQLDHIHWPLTRDFRNKKVREDS